MRWLALVGAVIFAYLAIVPGGLIVSIFDSACAGADCETSVAQDALLTVLYTGCLAGIAATAATLALYGLRPDVRRERRVARALIGSIVAVGATLFALFALAWPLAALFTFGVGGMVYGLLRYNDRPRPAPADPASNGHGKLNGHPG